MPLLYTASGDFQPSPEIRRRLESIDPALGLMYHHSGKWAVTYQWPEHDQRRAWIRGGQYPPDRAFDILGFLPLHCPPDEAGAYVERNLRGPQQSADMLRLADAFSAWNRKVSDAHAESAVAPILNDVEIAASSLSAGRIAMETKAEREARMDRIADGARAVASQVE